MNFEYTYSDFFNNGFSIPTGTNNISSDPLFIDTLSGDYHLQETSFCIDSGTSQNAPLVDFEGINRPQGAGFDMGISEYHETLGINDFDVKKMTVYPNPTSGKISLPSQYNNQCFEVASPTGKIVKSGSIKDSEIDLSNLETCVYYIKMGEIDTVKVVLK